MSEQLSSKNKEYKAYEWDMTALDFLEWKETYLETSKALNSDYRNLTAKLSREELEKMAMPAIETLNQQRAHQGADPVDITTASPQLLSHLSRPNWRKHLPKTGSPKDLLQWETFKEQWPEHIRINLEGLRQADTMLVQLASDKELREEVQQIEAENYKIMRKAVRINRYLNTIDNLSIDIAQISRIAGTSNRLLTVAEKEHIKNLKKFIKEVNDKINKVVSTIAPDEEDKVKEVLKTLVNRGRRQEFERGIVLTDQMRQTVTDLLPSLFNGQPALLVGETGGAKTALAKFISRSYFNVEPELISGHGDINSYQIIGKMGLKNGRSIFEPGPLLRAMELGLPVILDEITAMPADVLKRLNVISQLRSGDEFIVQEDGSRKVRIAEGFVIIATANEKSKRYKGIQDLSTELLNRFGANVKRVRYPDHDVVYGQLPVENLIIALAALTDDRGRILPVVEEEELERFVKACHISQQVFVGNFGDGFRDFISQENSIDNTPGLDETVLAPRTMVAILEKLRYSHGHTSLEQILMQFVEGIKNPNDRQQIILILKGQGFFQATKTSSTSMF